MKNLWNYILLVSLLMTSLCALANSAHYDQIDDLDYYQTDCVIDVRHTFNSGVELKKFMDKGAFKDHLNCSVETSSPRICTPNGDGSCSMGPQGSIVKMTYVSNEKRDRIEIQKTMISMCELEREDPSFRSPYEIKKVRVLNCKTKKLN